MPPECPVATRPAGAAPHRRDRTTTISRGRLFCASYPEYQRQRCHQRGLAQRLPAYLPSFCSIRMTDIQRIAWENGWHILFHGATVRQERNDHDLMRDFADEIPGYLHNYRIRKTLEDLPLRGGKPEIMNNIMACYAALVKLEVVASGELPLVEAWAVDLEGVLAVR